MVWQKTSGSKRVSLNYTEEMKLKEKKKEKNTPKSTGESYRIKISLAPKLVKATIPVWLILNC